MQLIVKATGEKLGATTSLPDGSIVTDTGAVYRADELGVNETATVTPEAPTPVDTTPIVALLEQLAEYKAQRDVLGLNKQALIDSVLTPEIKAKLAEIEAEFAPQVETVNANIATLEAEIGPLVVATGATVKSERLMAVWSKPRVKWNTDKLEGYAAEHPEILKFAKTGQPSVAFRNR